MQTDKSIRATHTLIASDRVEGTLVRDACGVGIGAIERVMIEKLTGNVAYALLRIDDGTKNDPKYLPISWPRLTYDRKLGAYHVDLIEEELTGTPCLGPDQDFNWSRRRTEIEVPGARAKSYWGIAESW